MLVSRDLHEVNNFYLDVGANRFNNYIDQIKNRDKYILSSIPIPIELFVFII